MRRLYWRIYTGIVLVIVLFAVLVGGLRLLDAGGDRRDALIASVAATVADLLPPADAPARRIEETLDRLARRFDADARVYSSDARVLAAAGDPVPAPPDDGESGWVHDANGHGFALKLPDGRWLIARQHGGPTRVTWVVVLAALAIAIAIGAHPLARRITRRLERLQAGVEELGAGDLAARVPIEGRDEVAELARAFNRAAGRIERLVEAQRTALAGASHELRSPLARIRMAVELAADGIRPDLRERLERDVAELDDLIEELLLASRLQAGVAAAPRDEVDLRALLEDEAARVGAACIGEDVSVVGDARALRRMLRNLLENASRHGGGAPVSAAVRRVAGGGVEVVVDDAGPGVPAALRERIFEPFFRLPGARESTDGGIGLGLALVRAVARHHAGEVVCEPRDGGGTRLRVTLPGVAERTAWSPSTASF